MASQDTYRTRTERRDLTARRTIAGLFRDRADAEEAVRDLKEAGFAGDQIGIAMRDRTEQGELVEQTGTHAAAGAVSGVVGGGLLGGLVGFLLGIGAIAIPGIGPIVAGGALASALGIVGGTAAAGAGIGAAAGGLIGALIGMGIPETEARHFEAGVRAGGVLVTVEPRGRTEEAMAILERHGADTGADATAMAAETNQVTESTTTTTAERRDERRDPGDVRDRDMRDASLAAMVPPAIPAPEAAAERPSEVEREREREREARPRAEAPAAARDAERELVAAADSPDQATAQGRAEGAIERSFVGGAAGPAGAAAADGRARTGTSDVTYNLVSIIYHALQGVQTYDSYIADAERGGDRELARFFRDVQEENRRRADRARELLRERLG